MDRKKSVLQYFQKSNFLSVDNKDYRNHLTKFFLWSCEADATQNDITAKALHLKGSMSAIVVAKQAGVIAGIEEVSYLLKNKTKLKITNCIKDGSVVSKGEVIIELHGDVREILAMERVILNILGRMSGIATYTSSFLPLLHDSTALLAATRKTPLMLLDKKAVAVGGGVTHRLSLSDFPLVKDNHIAAIKKSKHALSEVLQRMFANNSFFEIEVQLIEEACIVVAFVEEQKKNKKRFPVIAIMLDNFTPQNATKCVLEIKKSPVYRSILIEASGEITKENVSAFAKTDVDVISMGTLTHSAPTFNISLKIQ